MPSFNAVDLSPAFSVAHTTNGRRHRDSFLVLFSSVPPVTPFSIASVVALNTTTIRVTFNVMVQNNQALRDPGNYKTTATLVISAVTPQPSVSFPIYVDLTVSEMQQGGSYTLDAYRIDTSDTLVVLHGTFTGIGTSPTLVSAIAISDSTVRVTYSEPMAPGSGVLNPASYSITHGGGSVNLAVVSATPDSQSMPTYVDLVVDTEMTIGANNYTMHVPAGATDLVGNVLAGGNTMTFNGRATVPTVLYAATDATDLGHLRVAFSKAVKQINPANTDDALNPANYAISGAAVVSVLGVTASIVKLAVTGQGLGSHTLTVTRIQDLANNPVPA